MKKYLMSGVAAIAFLAAFTSCSKSTDLYDQNAVDERNKQEQEQKIENNIDQAKAKYAAAFEKAFGKVGSNVDWGFSSSANTRALTRALGDYDDYKGNLQPTYPSWMTPITFPSAPSDANFKTTPSELEESTSINAGNGTYLIGANTTSVNLYGAGTIYVVGNCAPTSFYAASNSKIYIQDGATLTLTANDAANTQPCEYYIFNGGALNTSGELKVNNGLKIYNQGTITANKLSVNNNSILYNQNIVSVTTEIAVENNISIVVNDGTINAASSTLRGGGHIQNNAEWLISGNTVVNSNNATWVNNGYWKTNNYEYIGGSSSVVNNCKLEVLNNFNMNVGQNSDNCFKIDTGGGVITKNFNGGTKVKDISGDGDASSGPYKIVMGHGSVFKVTETATLDGGNSGWGFFGPSSGEYAVFQAKNVVKGRENAQGMVTYSGNLYVSAETHFAQGNDGNANNKYIYELDGFDVNTNIYAAGFQAGKPDINIQETPCNPGFEGKAYYRVIAEDLNADQASDFDFNDVVFDVIKAENGKTTLKLVACGGIYKLTVAGQEVHGLFGETSPNADGNYSMFNTGDGKTHDPVEFDINGTYDTPELINNIEIIVYKPIDGTITPCTLDAKKGVAASKILVNSSFGIVPERHSITDQYGNFTSYVQGTWDSVLGGKWWLK